MVEMTHVASHQNEVFRLSGGCDQTVSVTHGRSVNLAVSTEIGCSDGQGLVENDDFQARKHLSLRSFPQPVSR